MNGDARADDRLSNVAATLSSHGLHVTTGARKIPSRDDIGVFDLLSGQYAEVGYSGTGNSPGEDFLVLTYRTGREKDPDGAHMAAQVIRLLSAIGTGTGPEEGFVVLTYGAAGVDKDPDDRPIAIRVIRLFSAPFLRDRRGPKDGPRF